MTLTRRHVAFAGCCAAIVLANRGLAGALYHYSRENETASHIALVPLVTASLVFFGRGAIFRRPEWSPGWGVPLAAAGVVLAKWAHGADSLALGALGLVAALLGGFLCVYGVRAVRAALFPLLFLGFAVPPPGPVVDAATQFLKVGSADAVAGLFTLTGTTYYREGFHFVLPYFAIEVADACSGIRSSIGLLLTSLLAGYVFLDAGWKRAVVALLVVPLAILKNGVRIVTLTLLAMHVNPDFLSGQLHHDGGVVFYLIALSLLAPVIWLLRRSRPVRPLPYNVSVPS
jgi:exosortase